MLNALGDLVPTPACFVSHESCEVAPAVRSQYVKDNFITTLLYIAALANIS